MTFLILIDVFGCPQTTYKPCTNSKNQTERSLPHSSPTLIPSGSVLSEGGDGVLPGSSMWWNFLAWLQNPSCTVCAQPLELVLVRNIFKLDSYQLRFALQLFRLNKKPFSIRQTFIHSSPLAQTQRGIQALTQTWRTTPILTKSKSIAPSHWCVCC